MDARELHASLGVKDKFTDWAKRNILGTVGFISSQDFIGSTRKTKGRPRQDYTLSLDTAKHIALMSGTIKGHAVRKYFIEAEKELDIVQTCTADLYR